MLRRYRLIRMQIHQLMDACLFAIALWLAYVLRTNVQVADFLGIVPEGGSFENYVWLYLFLIPAAPVVLEAQGFYSRPMLYSRRATVWQLFKACLFMTLGLVLLLFLAKMLIARWIVIWFGGISFSLILFKEELIWLMARSELARAQYRRRFILVGSPDEMPDMRAQLLTKSEHSLEIVAELNLGDVAVDRLVDLLHEHAVNGV